MPSAGPAPTIHLRHRFDQPVGTVFRAWSEPEMLAAWGWGSLGHAVRAEVDFRAGGSFRVTTDRPDGAVWSFGGNYLAIDPGRRIVHTLEWQAPMGYESAGEKVEVRFTADGPGTIVEFTHTGVPDEASAQTHRRGWLDTFETLGARIATP
jgi:uncharacterized protein YndB with AHSA1/START domain